MVVEQAVTGHFLETRQAPLLERGAQGGRRDDAHAVRHLPRTAEQAADLARLRRDKRGGQSRLTQLEGDRDAPLIRQCRNRIAFPKDQPGWIDVLGEGKIEFLGNGTVELRLVDDAGGQQFLMERGPCRPCAVGELGEQGVVHTGIRQHRGIGTRHGWMPGLLPQHTAGRSPHRHTLGCKQQAALLPWWHRCRHVRPFLPSRLY